MDTMKGMKRSCYCGEVTLEMSEVTVGGFTQRVRDKGGIIFIDVRDRSGIVQLVFDETTEKSVFDKAKTVRSEDVLMAKGAVRARESVNNDIKTGGLEILVSELRILSKAETPPFEIVSNSKTNEELRLKYRYLDLRRQPLQKNLIMRHNIAKCAREYFYENGFIEIETPMMIKSTPEGARDYIVPSRIHNGKFYALPQSPQMYKQLLMISGFDKYIQLARCFRDEDLRADRQPEFTQIDLEMSFVDTDDIIECLEGFVNRLYKEMLNVDITVPLPRLTYDEAMRRYGSDKPDTRFAMEIADISEVVKDTDFVVFKGALENGGSVRGITAKGAAATLIVADKNKVTLPTLGALRLKVAKQLDIISEGWNFVWITEFPFFEYDEETGEWLAMHHPFTMPLDEHIQYLDNDKSKVRAKCYDLVLNGVELLSGSIRINDPELQQHMFEMLGMTDEEINAKFGFLVDAYKYAAPPHGGAGIGLDRLAMLMCGCDSLRDVVAFPKVQNVSELMSEAPSFVSEEQLAELGIKIAEDKE